MRIERVVLEHHRDVAIGGLDLVDDSAADVDLAAGDGLQPRDHAEQRRLATAAWSDQHAELAIADIDIDALDGLEAAGIGLADVAQDDVSHGNPLLLLRFDQAAY